MGDRHLLPSTLPCHALPWRNTLRSNPRRKDVGLSTRRPRASVRSLTCCHAPILSHQRVDQDQKILSSPPFVFRTRAPLSPASTNFYPLHGPAYHGIWCAPTLENDVSAILNVSSAGERGGRGGFGRGGGGGRGAPRGGGFGGRGGPPGRGGMRGAYSYFFIMQSR